MVATDVRSRFSLLEGVAMFDTDSFVAECIEAAGDPEPRLAIRDLLRRATADPASMARALPPERAGITRLHVAPDLTILEVVWAPGMTLGPHDHRMWATIGIYTGGEDNTFFRRSDGTLADSGGKRAATRRRRACSATTPSTPSRTPPPSSPASIHIYGGDFFATERSEWRGDPFARAALRRPGHPRHLRGRQPGLRHLRQPP